MYNMNKLDIYIINTFDYLYYLDMNLDLRENGIITQHDAWIHWTTYGYLEENRFHRLLQPRCSLITDHIKVQKMNATNVDVKGGHTMGFNTKFNNYRFLETGIPAITALSDTFPVSEGKRISESKIQIEEEIRSQKTYSGLTSTRVSTKYGFEEMKPGFGADVSFQIANKNGSVTELGVIGMVKSKDGEMSESGHVKGDVVFNSWAGDYVGTGKTDKGGGYETARITHDGNLLVKKGIEAKHIKVNGEHGIKIGNTVLTESKLIAFMKLVEVSLN